MFAPTKLNRIAIAVALSIGFAAPAFAQETSSAVRGNILGPQGNPAAGTAVTIKHVPTGTVKSVVVGANGQFNAVGLRVGGPYEITLYSDKFDDAKVTGVFLTLGEALNFNYALASKENVEVVEVRASQLSSLAFGQKGPASSFGLETLENAPAINRNITDIIRIDPRVFVDETSSANSVQCVGKSNRFNSLTVDGVKLNDSFGLSSSGYPTPVGMPFSYDAIEQVAVEIAPYDVAYSGFTGCNINAVTKSGTNEVTGSFFYEYGSTDLKGDSLEGDDVSSPDNDDKKMGFTLGAPLIKDELFAFVAYEKYEGSTLFTRGPIGSNAINEIDLRQEDLDRIKQISIDKYQYDPGTVPTSAPTEDEKLLVKLDWNISEDHRVSYTYNYNDGFYISQSDGDSNEFEFSKHLYEQGGELISHSLSLFSDWSSQFSTELRVSRNEVDNRQISIENVSGEVGGQQFGEMQISVTNPDSGERVTVYLGGDDSRSANDLDYSVDGLIFRGNYSADNGHEIMFGYEREQVDVFNVFVQHVETEMRFFGGIDSFEAGLPGAIYYNNAPSGDPNDAAAEWAYTVNAAYVQDEFYLTDDLLITAGVRYDWYTSDDKPAENADFVADYGFTNATNLDGKGLVQPRIAFNYTVNESTELRGGLGVFSGGNPNVWLSNNYSNNNVLQFGDRGRNHGLTDGSTSLFDIDYSGVEEGAPVGPGYGIPTSMYEAVAAGTGDNYEINYLDPDFDIPSEMKASVGLTHVTADEYVIQADLLYSVTSNAAVVKRGDLEQVGTTDEGYPEFDSVRMSSFELTNAGVDAKSITASIGVQKEYDNGIRLTAGYAYNDAEDIQPMTSSVAFSNYTYRVFSNPQADEVATSDYNIKHRLTAAISYATELFDGYKTNFSVFAMSHSGRPYSVTRNGNSVYNYTPYLEGAPVLEPGYTRNDQEGSWWTKADIRVNQQIPGFTDGHKANAYFVVDNFTNMLNDDWGIARRVSYNTSSSESRRGDASLWEVRVGVKYSF